MASNLLEPQAELSILLPQTRERLEFIGMCYYALLWRHPLSRETLGQWLLSLSVTQNCRLNLEFLIQEGWVAPDDWLANSAPRGCSYGHEKN